MKAKIYLRLGQSESGKIKVMANVNPSNVSLVDNSWHKKPIPTIAFAVEINLPDDAFEYASKTLAELSVDSFDPCVEVKELK